MAHTKAVTRLAPSKSGTQGLQRVASYLLILSHLSGLCTSACHIEFCCMEEQAAVVEDPWLQV